MCLHALRIAGAEQNEPQKAALLHLACPCLRHSHNIAHKDLIAEYNEDANSTYSFGKGTYDDTFEEAAFNLGTDEISNVVETVYGYHIIKCISTFDREQTELSKQEIVEQRRREVFGEEYDAFALTLVRQLNTKLWDEITLVQGGSVDTADFFEIYAKFFP